MSQGVRPPRPAGPGASVAPRPRIGRGLWLPALLSSLALLIVIGGIAVSQLYWSELRSGLSRMDQTLGVARERQQQMLEHLSRAQGLLLAQQRHLKEQEEALRARESALAAERAALADARARLALAEGPGRTVEDLTQARALARRLDSGLEGLADPGGLESLAETLDAVADWSSASRLVAGSPLRHSLEGALAAARDAVAAARAKTPARLAERLERVGAEATRLTPGPQGSGAWSPAAGLAAESGAGRLGEQLQTALFALRRGDEALFRLALDTARAWLDAFYDPARREVAALQQEIAELRRLPVRQDLDGTRAAAARARAVLGEIIEQAGRVESGPPKMPGPEAQG